MFFYTRWKLGLKKGNAKGQPEISGKKISGLGQGGQQLQ